jgi:CBS domain containing-hemolysin-like protein
VAGFLSVRRLESVLRRGIRQPEEVDSVGGLVSYLLDGEPVPGSSATWDGLEFRVETIEDGRPTRILVHGKPLKKEA